MLHEREVDTVHIGYSMSAVAIVAELLAHGVELHEDHGRITTNVDFDTLAEPLKEMVLNHHVSLVMWLGEGVVLG